MNMKYILFQIIRYKYLKPALQQLHTDIITTNVNCVFADIKKEMF